MDCVEPSLLQSETALRSLIDGLEAGYLFVFYFAGHGAEQQLGAQQSALLLYRQ